MVIGINLFDVLVFLVTLKILMDGYKGRLINEIFLLMSVIVAFFFSAHYYVRFGDFLGEMFHLIGGEFFVGYVLISVMLSVIYPLAREGWRILMNTSLKIEVSPWITTGLAAWRAFFIAILLMVCLSLTNNDFVIQTLRSSLATKTLRSVAGDLYQWIYDHGVSGRISEESLNRHYFETLTRLLPTEG